MKTVVFCFKFRWKFVPKSPMNNISSLVQIRTWRTDQAIIWSTRIWTLDGLVIDAYICQSKTQYSQTFSSMRRSQFLMKFCMIWSHNVWLMMSRHRCAYNGLISAGVKPLYKPMANIETEKLFWRNFLHWLHQKLSFWMTSFLDYRWMPIHHWNENIFILMKFSSLAFMAV